MEPLETEACVVVSVSVCSCCSLIITNDNLTADDSGSNINHEGDFKIIRSTTVENNEEKDDNEVVTKSSLSSSSSSSFQGHGQQIIRAQDITTTILDDRWKFKENVQSTENPGFLTPSLSSTATTSINIERNNEEIIIDENSSRIDKENSSEASAESQVFSSALNVIKDGDKSVEEKLAMIFEYPYILRKEKTHFMSHIKDEGRASDDMDDDINNLNRLIFCSKCETALSRLYKMYCEFTALLQAESRVLKTIQKIGSQQTPPASFIPMIIYYKDFESFQAKVGSQNLVHIMGETDEDSTATTTTATATNQVNIEWEKVESLLPEGLKKNFNSRGLIILQDLQNCQKLLESNKSPTENFINSKKTAKDNTKSSTKATKRKIPAKLRRQTKTNTSQPKRLTARQKKIALLKKKNNKLAVVEESVENMSKQRILKNSDEKRDTDTSQEAGNIDNSCTPSVFIISDNSSNSGQASGIKQGLKRRGRKPGCKKEISSAHKQIENSDEKLKDQTSHNNDNSAKDGDFPNEGGASRSKVKHRKRTLKKEFWYDDAKKDPSRTCNVCGKSFLYSRMMIHHKATVHEGKKPFACQWCGRSFTQNFILKKHTCDYSLASLSEREYLMLAREEQLFKWACNVCGKKFKERSSLNIHQMNHTGESFECELCSKKFRRPDHLRTHVKIVHSDEKKFICSKCGARFKTSSNLRAHERKHANPDMMHLCNICGRSIKTLSQMSRHQKTHDDILPFECPVCGKRFKMKDYLGQHLRKGKSCKRPGLNASSAIIISDNSDSVVQDAKLVLKIERPTTSTTAALSSPASSSDHHPEPYQTTANFNTSGSYNEFDEQQQQPQETAKVEESVILSPTTIEFTSYTLQSTDEGILTHL